MFIAVKQYKKTPYLKDKVFVFDTDDITLEQVYISDILDIEIGNLLINDTERRVMFTDLIGTIMRQHLFKARLDDYAHFYFNVDGIEIFIDRKLNHPLVINNTVAVESIFGLQDLQYFFKFRNMLILRFNCNGSEWLSFALDRNGKVLAQWNADFSKVRGLEIAQKVDMLCEV